MLHDTIGRTAIAVAAAAVIAVALGSAASGQPTATAHPFPERKPAPELAEGLRWLNTDQPLSVAKLRGRFVLLDFFSPGNVACTRTLAELTRLQAAMPEELVVIGVYSPRFDAEKIDDAAVEAIRRCRVTLPVVSDPEAVVWDAYEVEECSSQRLIDPDGNLVASHTGETSCEQLRAFLQRASAFYRERGTLLAAAAPATAGKPAATPGPLLFPEAVLFDPLRKRLFVADTGHDRIVVAQVASDAEGPTLELEQLIGTGQPGSDDGPLGEAAFRGPRGLAVEHGADADHDILWVADTGNNLIRRITFVDRMVTRAAGTLDSGAVVNPAVNRGAAFTPRSVALESPWGLWIHEQSLLVSMAGSRQIWRMPLDLATIRPVAGSGRDDVVDGRLMPEKPGGRAAAFAQPAGLTGDAKTLFVADCLGCAIRQIPFVDSPQRRQLVDTLVGLSGTRRTTQDPCGDADGAASDARLQYPTGLAWHDGRLFVADAYNHKIKVVDHSGELRTLAGTGQPAASDTPASFNEPRGLSFGDGRLFVADTNNHAIRLVDPADGTTRTLAIEGLEPPMPTASQSLGDVARPGAQFQVVDQRPASKPVRAKPVTTSDGLAALLRVQLEPPAGWKLNDLAAMSWELSVKGKAGPVDTSRLRGRVKLPKPSEEFAVGVPLTAAKGAAKVRLEVSAGICSNDGGECRFSSASVDIPLTAADDGEPQPAVELTLPE